MNGLVSIEAPKVTNDHFPDSLLAHVRSMANVFF